MQKSQWIQIVGAASVTSLLGYLINQLPAIPDFPHKTRWIVGGVILLTALVAANAFWQARQQVGEPAVVSTDKLLEIRQRLLQRLRGDVRLRLEGSLHNLTKIDLQMEDQRRQVGQPELSLVPEDPQSSPETLLNRSLRVFKQNTPTAPLKSTQRIIEVFHRSDIQGKLLILGEPGAGKTTELLTLAQDLVQQAIAVIAVRWCASTRRETALWEGPAPDRRSATAGEAVDFAQQQILVRRR